MGDSDATTQPSRPDREGLFLLASEQRGYFTAAQAAHYGYSRALLAHHAKTGTFRRLRPGLYRFRDYPSTPDEEVMAAWLALGGPAGGVVVSHESALDLWDLTDSIPNTIHFTVPRTRRHPPRLSGVTVHTTSRPLEPDDVRTIEGLRVTAPGRALLDVAESQGSDEGLGLALYRAIQKGWVTRTHLENKAKARGPRAARLMHDLLQTDLSLYQDRQADQT